MVLSSCQDEDSRAANERPNVVLVTFDTTRADYVGPYNPMATWTPHLDEFAARAMVFDKAFAPTPVTLPSHASILTGKAPFAHGVRDNGTFRLPPSQVTLAEILREQGYATGAAIASFPVTAQFGLNQGFDFYDDKVASAFENPLGMRVFAKQQLFFDERPAHAVNMAGLPWLDEVSERPFFLWLHYFDPHHPHTPPPPYDQLYANDPYAAEIAATDHAFGQIIAKLDALGVTDNTIVVMTADHGEGRGQHQEETHSMLLYNTTQHVPLVIHAPGLAVGRFAPPVSTMDIFPTILHLLNLEVPQGIQGESLFAVFDGRADQVAHDRPIYMETLVPRLVNGWGELRALVRGDDKYIHGPRPERYNLSQDYLELDDQVDLPDTTGLRSALSDYLSWHAQAPVDASVAVDDRTRRRLEGLGYLQGEAGQAVGAERLRSEGEPPQDHAAVLSQYSRAKQLLFSREWARARLELDRLIERDPDNPHYLELMVRAEMGNGNAASALQWLNQMDDPPMEIYIPVMIANNQAPGALQWLVSREADEPTSQGQLLLAALGEMGGRLEHLQRAVVLAPESANARLQYAVTLAEMRNDVEAKVEFDTLLDLAPNDSMANFNYAVFLLSQGERESALERFERVIRLAPNYLSAHQAVVETALLLGYRERAQQALTDLEAIAAGSQAASLARAAWERAQ